MARELAISLYLLVFKSVFALFNLFPLKDKTTFVVSFGDNSKYVFEEMRRQNIRDEVVFLCKGKSISHFLSYSYVTPIPFESFNIINWLRSIYHLSTSKRILVDNYFGFLAVTDFKDGVECIQLWHATGAVKKFGLEDQSIKKRSDKAFGRFVKVYKKFDKIVVGSDIMGTIFMKSFNAPIENILKTGIPRTDFFYNETEVQKAVKQLRLENKLLGEKKVILYAPTYRDNELDEFRLQLDIEKMKQKLDKNFVLILRLHPAVKKSKDYSMLYPGFVFDYSSAKYNINELLVVADYLITDYSSIPYEFSLMGKPMIFFTYDLERYKQERGINDRVEENFPGPIVQDTDSIINLLNVNKFDLTVVENFSKRWNKYSNGSSSRNLVKYMYRESAKGIQRQEAL